MMKESGAHAWGCRSALPPYILEAIARNGSVGERESAIRNLSVDHSLRTARVIEQVIPPAAMESLLPTKVRTISDAKTSTHLPGTTVRTEGAGATGDAETDEAYAGLGATFDFYWNVFQRNSIDANGLGLLATVHYDQKYDNAFWNGQRMVFGDGDGVYFNRFTISVDVIGHELTHGVTGSERNLQYQGQSGALNESISDVFGSMVKQYVHTPQQTAAQADWLIGAGLFTSKVQGVALRSMKAPGTAFNDPVLGKDPQPANMSDYVNTASDNGGVHTNSGIPNHAFYLAAIAFGGFAWEKAGRIWYETIRDASLPSDATFSQFAAITVTKAEALFGADAGEIVGSAWSQVGVAVNPFPNWQELDDNPETKQITADGGHLYQLHNTGRIWRYTGKPLTGWQEIDNNPATASIVASGGHLYQRHSTGRIFRYTGTPLTGWQEIDNNPATTAIVADGGHLYQLHSTGRIFRYTGTPLTGWQELDNNPATASVVASGGHLYQQHSTGRIFRYTGTPLTGWQEIDNNHDTTAIVADGGNLYQLHSTGRIFRYTGTPLTGWQELDNNPATASIAASGGRLYQLHSTKKIWRYTGTPLTGWQQLDHNPATVSITAGGYTLYQLHDSGKIWKHLT
jgi:Thermolysin metallopeptidase, alpha-helical domain/Thermolysin metallopeptidase, catalytic domain